MSDTAAHLVDRVLPVVAYRQWVLAYPRRLRLAFARDPGAASESATIFLREVFRAQRKRARRAGAKAPQVGAVCMTQCFGSRLDLNVHHHAVLPDGVFTVEGDEGTVDFLKLAPPARDDLSHMLERITVKTLAMVRRRGLLEEEPFDALASVQAEAVQKPLSLGAPPEDDSKKLAAFLEGFSLQAGTHVHERDRIWSTSTGILRSRAWSRSTRIQPAPVRGEPRGRSKSLLSSTAGVVYLPRQTRPAEQLRGGVKARERSPGAMFSTLGGRRRRASMRPWRSAAPG